MDSMRSQPPTANKFVDVSLLEPDFEFFSMASITASQPWTSEEDQQLQALVRTHGAKNWSQVAALILGRTGKQCRERWRNHIDPSINKEPFSAQEDNLILSLVEEMGTKWAKIAKSLPGRTDNSIKNRYYSSLLKKSHERRLNRFSAHEDALIISVVRRIGTKWSEVAKFLPGRTSKSIKNRYYSALKKSYPLAAMAQHHQQQQQEEPQKQRQSPRLSTSSSCTPPSTIATTTTTPTSPEWDHDHEQFVDDTSDSACDDCDNDVCASTPPQLCARKFIGASNHFRLSQNSTSTNTNETFHQHQQLTSQISHLADRIVEPSVVLSAVLSLCDMRFS